MPKFRLTDDGPNPEFVVNVSCSVKFYERTRYNLPPPFKFPLQKQATVKYATVLSTGQSSKNGTVFTSLHLTFQTMTNRKPPDTSPKNNSNEPGRPLRLKA